MWVLCTLVKIENSPSFEKPSAQPQVSTRTNCTSIDLMGISECSILT